LAAIGLVFIAIVYANTHGGETLFLKVFHLFRGLPCTQTKTLLINCSLIQQHLTFADYMKAVEDVHARHARGQVIAPGMLHADANNGEYHIKTGGIKGSTPYFGLKANGGFFQNQKNEGFPNISASSIYQTEAMATH
jgi:hypothetical protein